MFYQSPAKLCPSTTAQWPPKSNADLKGAIQDCLINNDYDCTNGPHGPIGSWDVSGVTDMSKLFIDDNWDKLPGASQFNGDLSNWVVSQVTNMHAMFRGAFSFEGKGLSNWDVSSVTDMHDMFIYAKKFNSDISNWDVSKVTDMRYIFFQTENFHQTLCGKWKSSTARKDKMFHQSPAKLC